MWRAHTALQACKFFGWSEGAKAWTVAKRLMLKEGHKLYAVVQFLKKSAPDATVATMAGKFMLKERKYQAAFFRERLSTWLGQPVDVNLDVLYAVKANSRWILRNTGQKRVPDQFRDLRWYIGNRLWMKSGATSWADMVPRGYQKTKTTIALANGTDEIMTRLEDELNGKTESYWTIHGKPEPMKTRAVVVTEMTSYLVLAYFMYFVLPYIKNSPYLYQAMDNSRKWYAWKEMQSYRGRLAALTLDYTTFDESVPKDFVLWVVKEVAMMAGDLTNQKVYMMDLGDKLVSFLDAMTVRVADESEQGFSVIRWLNGNPSGLYLTWLINALWNAGHVMQAAKEAQVPLTQLLVQGDDDIIFSPTTRAGYERLTERLTANGLVVNEIKSGFSAEGLGEFISLEMHDDGIYGDKWRMLRSIIWGQVEKIERGAQQVMSQRASLWLQYMQRKGQVDVEWVVNDLSGAVGKSVKRDTIKKMLFTAVANGGLGLFGVRLDQEFVWKGGEPVEDEEPRRNVASKVKLRTATQAARAWRRGMKALVDSLNKDDAILSPQWVEGRPDPKYGRYSVRWGLGSKRDYTVLPRTEKYMRIQPFSVNGDQELFDKELILSNLEYGQYTGWSQEDEVLRMWYNKVSRGAWDEVRKAGGYVVPSMPPSFALSFGETLAPLMYGALAEAYATGVQRFRVTKHTLWLSAVAAERYLPQGPTSPFPFQDTLS